MGFAAVECGNGVCINKITMQWTAGATPQSCQITGPGAPGSANNTCKNLPINLDACSAAPLGFDVTAIAEVENTSASTFQLQGPTNVAFTINSMDGFNGWGGFALWNDSTEMRIYRDDAMTVPLCDESTPRHTCFLAPGEKAYYKMHSTYSCGGLKNFIPNNAKSKIVFLVITSDSSVLVNKVSDDAFRFGGGSASLTLPSYNFDSAGPSATMTFRNGSDNQFDVLATVGQWCNAPCRLQGTHWGGATATIPANSSTGVTVSLQQQNGTGWSSTIECGYWSAFLNVFPDLTPGVPGQDTSFSLATAKSNTIPASGEFCAETGGFNGVFYDNGYSVGINVNNIGGASNMNYKVVVNDGAQEYEWGSGNITDGTGTFQRTISLPPAPKSIKDVLARDGIIHPILELYDGTTLKDRFIFAFNFFGIIGTRNPPSSPAFTRVSGFGLVEQNLGSSESAEFALRNVFPGNNDVKFGCTSNCPGIKAVACDSDADKLFDASECSGDLLSSGIVFTGVQNFSSAAVNFNDAKVPKVRVKFSRGGDYGFEAIVERAGGPPQNEQVVVSVDVPSVFDVFSVTLGNVSVQDGTIVADVSIKKETAETISPDGGQVTCALLDAVSNSPVADSTVQNCESSFSFGGSGQKSFTARFSKAGGFKAGNYKVVVEVAQWTGTVGGISTGASETNLSNNSASKIITAQRQTQTPVPENPLVISVITVLIIFMLLRQNK
ncbi:MAG: hypothetical protein AABW99_02055 [archaeon]